jgi:hypothetical protein
MSETSLDELDEVLRKAVEGSRRTPVPEIDLAVVVERIAARKPPALQRSRWRELFRRTAAAAAVLLVGALLVNQASAAWAEVAGAAGLSMQAAKAAPIAQAEGPPARTLHGLLVVHVISVVAGYACYAAAWLLSCSALVAMIFQEASRLLRATVRLSSVLLALGVLLMLLGVVLGAVWAKPNLGRYWDWDVREVNGLVTLLLGVAWLALSWRQMRSGAQGVLGRIEPGVVAAFCFWAAMAGWWWLVYLGNGVFLWQTGVFICLCVLVNIALIVGAGRVQRV